MTSSHKIVIINEASLEVLNLKANKPLNFNVTLEKNDKKIKLKCSEGCHWETLSFELNNNTPQTINNYGLNKVNARNADDSFNFVLIQDDKIFDLKSTKNTTWKGLSSSAKEDLKLILLNDVVKKDSTLNNPQSTKLETGFLKTNNQTLYYTNINGKITYYNRQGIITNKAGNEITPGKQENADNILPNSYITKVFKDDKIVSEFKDIRNINQQKPPTKKQIAAYNDWAKKLNKQIALAEKTKGKKPHHYPIIKRKDVEKYKHIYGLISNAQRANVELFPNLPEPPPRAPKPANKKLNTMPPPAPPKTKDSRINNQQDKTIQGVEITIKKDKLLELNGKPVSLENFVEEVKKLNQRLTVEQQREHVFASIMVESNDQVAFSKDIQNRLRKANVYQCAIGYNETKRKSGLPIKHFNLNAGLSIDEAREQRKEMLEEDKYDNSLDKHLDSLTKKGEKKWNYKVETSFVEDFENVESKMNTIKYNGYTYIYHNKKGENKLVFYDKYGLIVDEAKIKILTDYVMQNNKRLSKD
ncbi:hypothetical protein [Winogradskyella sp.]|uniref:hypothetical protein n=1 Tax=Winogradskyella sp. TaxID=1883156 RepID=UPI0025D772D4|nr:hypothetical protein [Winogradskyella sp.]MBT8244524.1 hypothetical protein [Winogradskyella sp.]